MIFIVYGTRAELIKFSTLIKELKSRKVDFKTVDIGQHENEKIRKSLGLPKPDFHLGSSYRKSWSRMEALVFTYPVAVILALVWGLKTFVKLAGILSRGDIVVTHGNAMGVPLAIYATKISGSGKKLVHMESGFRGNTASTKLLDFIYKLADSKCNILFTPYRSTESNLRAEGVDGKIVLSGDVMKDVVKETLKIKPRVRIPSGSYILANSTRSIVDKHDANHFLHALHDSPMKTVLILNPVISRRIERFGLAEMLKSDKIIQMPPVDYPDFLHLLKRSSGAITDSTGVEEECAALGKPCIVTNDFLQIPELENIGVTRKTGCNYIGILTGLRRIHSGRWKTKKATTMGAEGSPTKRIVDELLTHRRETA